MRSTEFLAAVRRCLAGGFLGEDPGRYSAWHPLQDWWGGGRCQALNRFLAPARHLSPGIPASPHCHLPLPGSCVKAPQTASSNYQGCFLGPHNCLLHKALARIRVVLVSAATPPEGAVSDFIVDFFGGWQSSLWFPARHAGLSGNGGAARTASHSPPPPSLQS